MAKKVTKHEARMHGHVQVYFDDGTHRVYDRNHGAIPKVGEVVEDKAPAVSAIRPPSTDELEKADQPVGDAAGAPEDE